VGTDYILVYDIKKLSQNPAATCGESPSTKRKEMRAHLGLNPTSVPATKASPLLNTSVVILNSPMRQRINNIGEVSNIKANPLGDNKVFLHFAEEKRIT
jgi:hypothetical protein